MVSPKSPLPMTTTFIQQSARMRSMSAALILRGAIERRFSWRRKPKARALDRPESAEEAFAMLGPLGPGEQLRRDREHELPAAGRPAVLVVRLRRLEAEALTDRTRCRGARPLAQSPIPYNRQRAAARPSGSGSGRS